MTIAKRRTGAFLLALLVVALLAAACSSSKKNTASTSSSGTQSSSAPAATGGTVKVAIKNFSFKPSSATVKVGQSVVFTNNDSTTHTATAKDNTFDTGDLGSGQSKTITFSKAGTYTYICSIHNYMKGTITVTN